MIGTGVKESLIEIWARAPTMAAAPMTRATSQAIRAARSRLPAMRSASTGTRER